VQWEALSQTWRLHILEGKHSCSEDLPSIEPEVGIDFSLAADAPITVPPTGSSTTVGVVFVPKDRPDVGAFTTTSGVTLQIDRDDATPGGRWTGHLKVEQFSSGSDTYAFDGGIDAEVCKPS